MRWAEIRLHFVQPLQFLTPYKNTRRTLTAGGFVLQSPAPGWPPPSWSLPRAHYSREAILLHCEKTAIVYAYLQRSQNPRRRDFPNLPTDEKKAPTHKSRGFSQDPLRIGTCGWTASREASSAPVAYGIAQPG